MAKKRGEHAEELALLEAIREDWENEPAWMALADWLENNGDPDTGYTIRVETLRDSNRLPYDEPLPPRPKKAINKKAVDERKKDIDAVALSLGHSCGHVRGMRVPCLALEHMMSGKFDQVIEDHPRGWGWCCGLAVSGEDTTECAEWLMNWPRLADLPILSLGWFHLGLRRLLGLARSPNVRNAAEVGLGDNYLTPEALAELVKTPLFQRVSRLQLSCTDPADGLRVLAGATLPRLRRLTVTCPEGDAVGNAGMAVLATAPWLGQLTHLHLEGQHVGDEGVTALVSSPAVANLRILWLYRNDITPEGARALAESPHLTSLVHLQMMSNPSGKRGAKLLLDRFGERHCQA